MNESSQTTSLQELKPDPRASIELSEDIHVAEPPNPHGHLRPDGKRALTEDDEPELLGYSWPTWRKWQVLSVIFAVQVSMNFNASVFPNAVPLLADEFGVSLQKMRVAQMIFLIAYAFGSELWAPWSEELGRWPILQCSLFLVNIWQILCGLAPNYGAMVVGRFLGGLSSAGGSVTLGMVADMWDADDQQYAIAFVVLSSVGGSVVGPIVGGFLQANLSWHWNFWVQLIFGGVVQAIHFFLVPETLPSAILDKEAKRRRNIAKKGRAGGEKENEMDRVLYGPGELKEERFSMKEILITWARPFEMFAREPIVLFLSLLSGFSDGLIFLFLDAFSPVYEQWGFGTVEVGLSFIPILIGYFIAYITYIPPIMKFRKQQRRDPEGTQPEARLWWLLWTAPLEPIGLFGFAWTSLGPGHTHWIAPMIFSVLIAIANYTIYMSTIDYMVASYGIYSASATGGNALARDFIAGISAMYATPLYANLGTHSLEWASTLLGFLGILVVIPVFVFYYKGPEIRAASKFAQSIASERAAHRSDRKRLREENVGMTTVEKPARGNGGTRVERQGVRTGDAGLTKEKAEGEIETMEENIGMGRR